MKIAGMKKVMLKILPDNFENALAGSNSLAYQEWREKEFPDWSTLTEIEDQLQKNNYCENWLEVFPEAKETIVQKILEYEILKEKFIDIIKEKLKIIKDKAPPDDQWFWKEWVKINEVEELIEVENHIKRLKFIKSAAEGRVPTGRITDEDIKKAKQTPIENIINKPLKKVGKNLITNCPFHDDRHPSFYIYPQTNTCWCFSCGQGGDSISFAMLLFGLDFIAVVKQLNGIK